MWQELVCLWAHLEVSNRLVPATNEKLLYIESNRNKVAAVPLDNELIMFT